MIILAAALAQSVLHDDAHQVTLIWERNEKDHVITVKETWALPGSSRIVVSTYSESGGLASRMVATTRGTTTKRTEATIDAKGATIQSGDRTARITPAKKLSMVDPSVLWFVKDKPKEGTTTTFTSFDPEFRYWEEVTVTYVGRTPEGDVVTRRGARGTVRIVFDEKGLPVAWQEGRFSLKTRSAPLARTLRRY